MHIIIRIIPAVILVCVLAGGVHAQPRQALDCKLADGSGNFASAEKYRIFLLHERNEALRFFDENCNGILEDVENAKYRQWVFAEVEHKVIGFRNKQLEGIPQRVPDAPKEKIAKGGWQHQFILRDSFEDVAVFSSVKKADDASGAQFSFARDDLARNTVWSAKGVMAYPVFWTKGDEEAWLRNLIGFAVGPTVSFNRVSNSRTTRGDVDILTAGGVAEFAFRDTFNSSVVHVLRARGALATAFDGTQKSWIVTGEYQPVTTIRNGLKLSSPDNLGSLPLTFQIDPILRVQHTENSDVVNPVPLFAFGNSVSRVGPVVMLSVKPLGGPASPAPKWLQKANFNVSYSWLADMDRRQNYEFFMASVGFMLDNDRRFGLKLSYENGSVEETGARIEMIRASLAVKY